MSYQELSCMYESLFDEMCVAKLDNIKLNLNIIDLQEEVESFQLVRTNLSEKVISLEAQIRVPYEKGSAYGEEDERDDLIAALEAKVQ